MTPAEVLAQRLKETFAATVIDGLVGAERRSGPVRVIGVPNARTVFAGKSGVVALSSHAGDPAAQLLARFDELARDPAGVDVLIDAQDPDDFLGVIGASELRDRTALVGAIVADAAELAPSLDAAALELVVVEAPEPAATSAIGALESCVRSLGFSPHVEDSLLQLTKATLVVLAATTEGASPRLLSLVGPASQLTLIETGIVSMADGGSLTSFGSKVAAAARQVVAALDRDAAG